MKTTIAAALLHAMMETAPFMESCLRGHVGASEIPGPAFLLSKETFDF